MKRILLPVIVTVAALTLALPARRSAADDETKDIEIEIEAPLEGASCGGTSSTITVLGLTIDISTAQIEASAVSTPTASPTPATPADDGGRRGGSASKTSPVPSNCYYYCTPPAVQAPTGCAALTVGQTVEVKLASDRVPLLATEVKQDAASHNVKLHAPLQPFDTTAQTITVLGLSIDVSGAGLEGADDDSSDGHSQPIDLTHLMIGQSVEVTFASATAPLVATEVEVKNFTNQVEVTIVGPDGKVVSDVDEHGNPVEDVKIDVVQTVPVQSTSAGTGTGSATKVERFHTGSNGSFALSGLATARANIFVTRLHGGVISTTRRTIPVKGDAVRSLHLRLRSASSR